MSSNHEKDVALIRELAEILKEADLTEVEVTEGEKRLRVKREVTMAAAPSYTAVVPAAAPAAAAPAAVIAAAAAPSSDADAMTSPMVGTAYLSPKPGDPSFVKVGDSVKEGQTVMIIEAMKVMNPIKAAKSGTIKDILVKDAQPVEFGQALMIIA